MIYITGDIHGELGIKKLSGKSFREQRHMSKNDYLIILGDFGLVWDDSESERRLRTWLNNKHFTTLFIDGNHDNHNLIHQYPEVQIFGGKAHQIDSSIYHLCRGEVYHIDGHSFLTLGGADSIDRWCRIEGESWWSTETITQKDLDNAYENVDKKCDLHHVDYVLTHAAPHFIEKMISPYISRSDSSMALEILSEYITFNRWFFGHYHLDYIPMENDPRFIALFEQIFSC